jgi:hypothetical protein
MSNHDRGFYFTHVAERLEPAWARWQETSARCAESIDLAQELATSRDMDAIMAFRIRPEFVAFDMVSRCIRRLAEMTTWSEPRNDAERAVQAQALGRSQAMRDTETFTVMRRLSAHLQQLQGEGLRARNHRHLRDRQQNLQHEYSTAFEAQFSNPLPVGPVNTTITRSLQRLSASI